VGFLKIGRISDTDGAGNKGAGGDSRGGFVALIGQMTQKQEGRGDGALIGKILGSGSPEKEQGAPRQGWAKKKLAMAEKVGGATTPERLEQGKNPFMGSLSGLTETSPVESSPKKSNPFKQSFGIGSGTGVIPQKIIFRGFGMLTPTVLSQREVFDKKSFKPGPNPFAALFSGFAKQKQPAKKLTSNNFLLELLAFGAIRNSTLAFDKNKLIRFSRSILADLSSKNPDPNLPKTPKSSFQLFQDSLTTSTHQTYDYPGLPTSKFTQILRKNYGIFSQAAIHSHPTIFSNHLDLLNHSLENPTNTVNKVYNKYYNTLQPLLSHSKINQKYLVDEFLNNKDFESLGRKKTSFDEFKGNQSHHLKGLGRLDEGY
jgi:hypothetical protein